MKMKKEEEKKEKGCTFFSEPPLKFPHRLRSSRHLSRIWTNFQMLLPPPRMLNTAFWRCECINCFYPDGRTCARERQSRMWKRKWFVSPRMSLICMTTSEETRTERQRFDMKRLLRDKLQAGKIFLRVDKQDKNILNNCKKKCKDDSPLIHLRNLDTTFLYRQLHLLIFTRLMWDFFFRAKTPTIWSQAN